jgi:hypothetical protein
MGHQEKGIVIIAVLWICSLLMWFALQISAEIRLQGAEDINYLRRSQALYLGIGGAYEALARLGQSSSKGLELREKSHEDWLPDGEPRVVWYETGQATVVIEKEQEKVNINKADNAQLRTALARAGLEENATDTLADMIADFIDADELPRLKGAELDHYRRMGLPYGPFDGPLQSVDQLLLIPGITPQLLYGGQGSRNIDEEATQEGVQPAAPYFGKNSLINRLTVYGHNVGLPKNDEVDGLPVLDRKLKSKPLDAAWEKDGIYRILSYGETYTGPPSVMVWLIVRYLPNKTPGYEVLFKKIL